MMPADGGRHKPQAKKHGWLGNVLAIALLSLVAAGCFSLGLWQLDRAAERDALKRTIERGRLLAPLTLSADTPAADLSPWRAAAAQGHWAQQHTVLLENRNLDGRPGYWVATPLLLNAPNGAAERASESASGKSAPPQAILVLRGWLPRDLHSGGVLPAIPREPGLVQIRGELHAHVPRIFELWEWAGGAASGLPVTLPQTDGTTPVVQNLELGDYARASGLDLLPAVLAQTHDTVVAGAAPPVSARAPATPAALQREWPGPSLDSDQNRGYALQWFSFCAIAAIAAAFIAYGLLQRKRRATGRKETP